MKEMALKRTLISKTFWGNLLEAHALSSALSELKSVSLFSFKRGWNVWAIPFIYYIYKMFIDWVTVKLSELHYGLTVSMLKKISQNFYVCVQK